MPHPPSTPTRSRLAPPPQGSSTPAPRSPAALRVGGRTASASPQVKAALAALRARKQEELKSTSSSSSSSSALDVADPFSTPPRLTSRAHLLIAPGGGKSSTPGVGRSVARTKEGEQVLLDWGGKSESQVLSQGGRTGKLNLASRSLTRVPTKVYSTLMALSSPYHPSHRAAPPPPPSSNDSAFFAQTSAEQQRAEGTGEEEEEEQLEMYEQQELLSINLGNNELTKVEEEIGGFEELEVLDLRSNLLPSLPLSLLLLTSLTTLNLSHNLLTLFPPQLLALTSLVKLDLSHNRLTSLWSPGEEWREDLEEVSRGVRIGASPSRTPESAQFSRQAAAAGAQSFLPPPAEPTCSSSSSAPFPSLTTLLLSHNPLSSTSLSSAGFELPPKLLVLDLGHTPLGRGRGESLPMELIGKLGRLERLGLERVGAGDGFWSSLGDDEEVEANKVQLFPRLKHLALGGNSLDSLAALVSLFERRVRVKVVYEGVERAIGNLMVSEERLRAVEGGAEEGRRTLTVDLMGNPLSLERERRRARFPDRLLPTSRAPSTSNSTSATPSSSPPPSLSLPLPAPPPSPPTTTTITKVPTRQPEPWELEALSGLSTPLGRRRAAAAEARRREAAGEKEEQGGEEEGPPPYVPEESPSPSLTPRLVSMDSNVPSTSPLLSPPSPAAAPQSPPPTEDPAVLFLLSHLPSSSSTTPTSTSISLTSLSLTSLPSPSSSSLPPPLQAITSLDLSLNLLPSLPLRSLSALGWAGGLTVLKLSRNKLAAQAFLELTSVGGGGGLPSLRELDLSHNELTSAVDGEGRPTLRILAGLGPRLEVLNLEYNKLTTLEGVEALVLSLSSSSTAGGAGGGVKQLLLRGNKIDNVEALCEVGRVLEAEGRGGENGRGRWSVEVLDLRDNEIGRLPPPLGLLPHEMEIHLLGNRFRVPRVEVYENAGARRVLPWLRERM